jgi:rare lipoprotein A
LGQPRIYLKTLVNDMEFIGFVWAASLLGSLLASETTLETSETRPGSWHENLAVAVASIKENTSRNAIKVARGISQRIRRSDRSVVATRIRPKSQGFMEVSTASWATGIGLVEPPSTPVAIVPVGSSHSFLDPNYGSTHCFASTREQPYKADRSLLSYQIQVNGYPVATLPSRHRAEAIARHWETVLASPDFEAEDLEPITVSEQPAGVARNQLLFTISPSLAADLEQDGELLAIAWVNNLRSALGSKPFSLADAQLQMHDLTPTQQTLAGIASWYGPYFHGRLTATGETFDQYALTAAHPSLPFDTYLLVTNQENGRSVVVRINDRGPYYGRRSLDLSRAAARCVGSEHDGIVSYEAVVLWPDENTDKPLSPFPIPEEGETPQLARN